jgi:hypothetical protein
VHRHVGPEGGDALRELAVRALPKPQYPVVERGPDGLEEPRVLAIAQRSRLPYRRELRPVEDLVGVRVADAGEDVRIRERALQRLTPK